MSSRAKQRIDKKRSARLDRAALASPAEVEQRMRDARDVEIIDRNAERLNQEALDTLEYQQVR